MVFGTFDWFHPGHSSLISQAEKLGHVIVVVGRGKNVRTIKGRKPDQSERVRKEAIQKEFPNVTVVLGSTSDFLAPIRAHSPHLLLLGYDQALPPGIQRKDLPRIRRAKAHSPQRYKSSIWRHRHQK
jgi:cytidyltransferase-like protein